jgi:hypothetical protein
MNECVNYCLSDSCRINRARIVTEAARRLNVWINPRKVSGTAMERKHGEIFRTPRRTPGAS